MNVIVIINDTWRWDYMGCYGNDWIKTPNLDKLASESAQFDYCYSEGLPTVPTRKTFFTGRYTFPFRGWQRLEPTDVLLAEILWNKGYTSAMFTDVYHLHKPSMAFERGFDYTKHIRGHEGDPHILDDAIEVDVEKYYKGDVAPWCATNVIWTERPVWVIEGRHKSQYYNYGRQIHWVDKETFNVYWKEIYDRSDEYWKMYWVPAW